MHVTVIISELTVFKYEQKGYFIYQLQINEVSLEKVKCIQVWHNKSTFETEKLK